MKNGKKLISLALTLAMIMALFSVVPVMSASADAGDVFSVTNLPDGWRFYTSSYVTRTSGSKFTVGASTNKGNGLDNYGILACNSQSADIIKANTAYKIKFSVETWFTLAQLEVNIDTGTALWSRKNSVQRFTDLSSRSSNSSGGGGSKLYTDLTFNVVTPADITGNQHFVIGIIPQSGNVGSTANLAFKDITITELGSYDVIDEDTGETVGTVYGLEDDDVYELIDAAGLSVPGYYIVADPEYIESDTTQITVSYNLDITDVQDIKFDSTYAGGSPDWHYIPDGGYVSLSDGMIHHTTSTAKGDINNHSVTLANSYGNSGLVAGGTYRLTFTLKTFPRYRPLESLAAEIRFGQYVWDNTMAASTISLTGEDLAAAVTGYTPANSGSVTFNIALDVTLPETGWASDTARNIILAIYGGEYWLDNVKISTTGQFKVYDSEDNLLGKAYGLVGDSTASIIPQSLIGSDYTYTTSPATISTYQDRITLTKSLKTNIAQKINFASDEYLGNSNDASGHYYSKDESNKKLIKRATDIKGEGVNVGATFGHRAIVIANDRLNSGLVAGNSYRVTLKFTSWNALSNFGLQVKFGRGVWNTINAGAATYTGTDFTDLITTLRPLTNNQSGSYMLTLDVTLPETEDWGGEAYKDIILSLYGTGANTVDYFLSTAYVYSSSTATVTSYDGNYTATAKGYEGDSIGSVISDDGAAKFLNVSGKFGLNNQNLKSGLIIYRGDANADFVINADDVTMAIDYLLGKDEAEGCDLFGVNVSYGSGNDAIDVRDLVKLKRMLTELGDTLAANLPAGLHYNNYATAWNYEFNDNTVSTAYFDRQWGQNRNYSDIDPVGGAETKYSYTKEGMFVLAPDDNFGAGNTVVCDPITTKTTMKYTYGYLEINAKLPFNSANAPAFWLKSSPAEEGDPTFEIDLLETFGSTSSIATNIHCWVDDTDHNANAVSGRSATIVDTEAFHKYGVEWYKENGVSYISFYVDGTLVKTLSKANIGYNADFNHEMYLILENTPITSQYHDNISEWALSATAATHSDYPMDVCIDYVRLYQSTSNTGNTLTATALS